MASTFISAIGEISGVFLMNLNIEAIKETSENHKRVKDSYSVVDVGNDEHDEVFGQLYLLPEASILNIVDTMERFGISLPTGLKSAMYDFELPLVSGPAFPLFDLSRHKQSDIEFQMVHSVYYPFEKRRRW